MRYSVNYTLSFGIDVTQKEIDEFRKELQNSSDKEQSYFNLVVNSNSSDHQLAKFIGVAKYRVAEAVDNPSDIVVEHYSVQREKELAVKEAEKKS